RATAGDESELIHMEDFEACKHTSATSKLRADVNSAITCAADALGNCSCQHWCVLRYSTQMSPGSARCSGRGSRFPRHWFPMRTARSRCGQLVSRTLSSNQIISPTHDAKCVRG